MSDDAELLRRYADDHSEEAFAELVRRHLNLVYFAALRQVGGDAHRAKDVTQTVFTDLARKAAALSRHAVLTGWLYTSTHYAAAKAVRAEQRRQTHEQEAQTMNEILHDPGSTADWDRLRPVLDDVMLQLNEPDREAVLLRFFEGRPFAEVGAKLRLTDDAARMRVERALEKMRGLLAQRGVTSTTAALGLALTTQVAVAVPAGLATAVTGAALSGVASAGSATALIGFFQSMSLTKINLGIIGALAIAGGTSLAVQQQNNDALKTELAGLRQEQQEVVQLQEENRRLADSAAAVAQLRNDDADLARLRDEAGALKTRLQAASTAKEAGGGNPPAKSSEIYDSSKVDVQPAVRSQAGPVYPFEQRRAGVPGKVVVSFVVDANGDVQDAKALSSSQPEFEASAVEAVSKWKFTPGQVKGLPVNVQMQVPIVYSVAKGKTTMWF